jgi:glutathione S-transferase
MNKPKLISFKICPFVQRSVILLNEKGVDYDIEYIDVENPPEWFKEISPTGKVPLLEVGGQALFESAVISEYLDEVNPPSIHPEDPLLKAQNRAWVEYTSSAYMGFFKYIMAGKQEASEKMAAELKSDLAGLEKAKTQTPWFNGEDFSMVDIAAAPIFTRLNFLNSELDIDVLEDFPKLKAWSTALLERDSVKTSVVPDLHDILRKRMENTKSYLI